MRRARWRWVWRHRASSHGGICSPLTHRSMIFSARSVKPISAASAKLLTMSGTSCPWRKSQRAPINRSTLNRVSILRSTNAFGGGSRPHSVERDIQRTLAVSSPARCINQNRRYPPGSISRIRKTRRPDFKSYLNH